MKSPFKHEHLSNSPLDQEPLPSQSSTLRDLTDADLEQVQGGFDFLRRIIQNSQIKKTDQPPVIIA